ncbi:MAG TPA: O-antigen polysaccharide polymerase Wzy [Terracidiphilus sp.]|nr:O-antigen polysaccharide polymerase Wzy [Terracidiphilus sp.]
MKAKLSGDAFADTLVQRISGAVLISIAFGLTVFDAADISLAPGQCSLLMLAAMAIIAFAILKTPRGVTSLIGILFLGTLIFVAARPLLALVLQDETVYTLCWGTTVDASAGSVYRLLAFWTIGVSSLFGGYFLVFSHNRRGMEGWSNRNRICCKQAFIAALLIVVLLLPIMAKSRLDAFASGGYEALYSNQAQYSFSALRLVDFLEPLLFALAVLIDDKRYTRLMAATIIGYILTGALAGRRMEAGTWLLVAVWYLSAIQRKRIRLVWLVGGLAATALLFQSMEMLRGGDGTDNPILVQFFLNQGITFLLPALSWQLPAPPIHSIIGSILPMGAFYSLSGMGTAETASVGAYVCSQSSPALFAAGYGLGSSVYLEALYACGQIMALYAAACGMLGFLLRKWEERASSSRIALFFLCVSLPSLVSIQRGSLSTVTSQLLYLSAFMAIMYVFNLITRICEFSSVAMEGLHGAN